ncbi:Cc8l18.2-like protein [Plakobranchus ocellatus]|uniref:Cc8l18.2-like protein n=1 Tax=Plakobranchus ocellatus TaxID=259542 RepID=A0AAV4CV23_9GAST|nr:Cc8l18.2-like protein [Plakobranchus ocellatus]
MCVTVTTEPGQCENVIIGFQEKCPRRRLPSPPKSPSPKITPSKADQNKVKCKAFRQRMKEDHKLYEAFKKAEAARKRMSRAERTEEQKEKERLQSRQRSKAYRERKKAAPNEKSQIATRKDVKKQEERKERNRLAQQKCRMNMSRQKQVAERQRNTERMREFRVNKQPADVESVPNEISLQPKTLFTSPGSRRTATDSQSYKFTTCSLNHTDSPPAEVLNFTNSPPADLNHTDSPPAEVLNPTNSPPAEILNPAEALNPTDSPPGEVLNPTDSLPADVPNPTDSPFTTVLPLTTASKSSMIPCPSTARTTSTTVHQLSAESPTTVLSHTTVSEIEALVSLKSKRDKAILNAKYLIGAAAMKLKSSSNRVVSLNGISKRYLKNRPNLYANKESKVKLAVTSFFREHALHLPNQKCSGQKILDKPIKELYKLFKESHPGLEVSSSYFFKLRPKIIMSYMKTPLLQCLCEVCHNPRLKLECMNQNVADSVHFDSLSSLLDRTMCPKSGQFHKLQCIQRKCTLCKGHLESLIDEIRVGEEKTVSWKRWEKEQGPGSSLNLVKKTATLADLSEELRLELQMLPEHVFTYRWQTQQYSDLSRSLPNGWCLVTMDFAENYTCVQHQPQSAYYGYNQVTLHPVVLNYACSQCGAKVNESLVFVSDSLKHSSHFVDHVQGIIEQYLSAVSHIKKIVIFSDGCPGQYKSKVLFYYLAHRDTSFVDTVERCFFGA